MNVLRGAGSRDVLGAGSGGGCANERAPGRCAWGGARRRGANERAAGAGPGGKGANERSSGRRGRGVRGAGPGVGEPMSARGPACVGRGPAADAPMSARRVRGGRCASRGGGVGGGSGNSLQNEGSREGRRPGRSALRASRARPPPPPRLSKAGGPRSGAQGSGVPGGAGDRPALLGKQRADSGGGPGRAGPVASR